MTDKVIESPNQYFTTANIDTIDFAKYDKVELEIGCGRGDFLAAYSPLYPDTVFIGVERHLVSLRKAVKKVRSTEAHNNTILINADILYLFESQQFPPNTFDAIHLYFPDPWQKKRHFKRRFVVDERMALVEQKLELGGTFHAATDWEPYAEWMLDVLDQRENLENLAGKGNSYPRPEWRPLTKFERRGLESGHKINDFIFKKIK